MSSHSISSQQWLQQTDHLFGLQLLRRPAQQQEPHRDRVGRVRPQDIPVVCGRACQRAPKDELGLGQAERLHVPRQA